MNDPPQISAAPTARASIQTPEHDLEKLALGLSAKVMLCKFRIKA
jgi:hypothetical protein